MRNYFRAWEAIVGGIQDFEGSYPDGAMFGPDSDEFWKDEREDYLEAWQAELHASQALIQNANELALKSLIAEVSPYLLLLNNDVKFKNSSVDVDFSEMKTLDAVDLPRAVNALTPITLPNTYIERYGALRAQRNKYEHLGDTSGALDPAKLLADMAQTYLELWPTRKWLEDRVEAAGTSRRGFFSDKNWSHTQEVLWGFEDDRRFIPNTIFNQLFGAKKSDVRFACPDCCADWAVTRWGPEAADAQIAHYDPAIGAMHCHACGGDFPAEVEPCSVDGCDSNFSTMASEHWEKFCFRCGEIQKEADGA